MTFFPTFSREDIQASLEDWIYECNTPDIKSEGIIGIHGWVELTADEQYRLDLVRKLSEAGQLNDSQLEDFYGLPLKRGVKASIIIAIQEIDGSRKQIPKVEVTFKGKLNKDQFKKLLEFGWKIDKSSFKYIGSQEDIFDSHSKIAELISVTISCVNQYKWKNSERYQ